MTRPPLPLLAVLLLPALLAPACAGDGSAQKKPKREIILQTEALDEKVGDEAAEEVRASLGIVDDAALGSYVNQIGQRLVRHAPRRDFEYTFEIVDEDPPNAFALPGGHVFVSRGLLVLANSEAELANVLGHEIIHVAARHAAARQSVVNSIRVPFSPFAFAHIASYSRDQEREADRLGQGLSAVAGYDPEAMATFLRDLEYTERLEFGASRMPSFFATHPTTSERVASAGGRARVIRWQPIPAIAGDRAGYLRRIDGLVTGVPASEGVVRGDRFFHPDLGFSMRFPAGWEVHNTHAAVGALSPERDAQIFLEYQGLGRDPQLSAQEYLEQIEQEGFRPREQQPLKVGGLDAWRAWGNAGSPMGPVSVVFTWIAHESSIYRLTGAGRSSRYEALYSQVARSFRPLTPAQRASIHETRVRVVEAVEGETLAQLSARTGNEWNVQRTAVMNDVYADDLLRQGQLLKVAVSVPYEARTAQR